MRTRGLREAYEQKRRKKFVGQRLGVTPKSWLTPKRWLLIWNFVVFCSFSYMRFSCAWYFWKTLLRFSLWALREPLMRMMKKVLFYSFSSVFDRSMRSLAEIHNMGSPNWKCNFFFAPFSLIKVIAQMGSPTLAKSACTYIRWKIYLVAIWVPCSFWQDVGFL